MGVPLKFEESVRNRLDSVADNEDLSNKNKVSAINNATNGWGGVQVSQKQKKLDPKILKERAIEQGRTI